MLKIINELLLFYNNFYRNNNVSKINNFIINRYNNSS